MSSQLSRKLFTSCLRASVPSCLFLAFATPSYAQEKVTFQDQVLPIFRNACNNCHNADKKKAGLDLTSFATLMAGSDNGSIVASGDPGGSMLYKVITHAAEPTMPPKRDKLSAAELETVRKWIASGLLENVGGKAAAMSKPKVDLGAVVVSGKPAGPIAFPTQLSGEPLVHTARPGAVEALATSPWAPVIAVGGQKQVVLYQAQTLEVLGVLPFNEGVPRVLQFSRNGSILLVAGGQGAKLGKAVLFDVTTGNRLTDVGDELDEILAADISPDQKLVALGGPTRLIHAYDVADGKELYAIKKHTDWVTAIAISPDGQYLATGDRAGNLYVWEAKDGGELYSLTGHKEGIEALSFRGDSKVLLSGSRDGTLKLWNMDDGKVLKSSDAHAKGVTSATFTHDGRIVSCGRDKTVKVWDSGAASGKPLSPAFNELAMHATFDSEGQRVFAGDWSGVVRVWNVADGKMLGELSPNPPKISERLEAATKRLAEAEPQIAKADADLKAAKDAADKSLADQKANATLIETSKQTMSDSLAKAKAGETDVPAKAAAAARANDALAAARALVTKRQAALADAQKLATTGKAAVREGGAGVDVKAVQADLATKQAALDEAKKALAVAEESIKKTPDDAVAKQTLADARARVDRRTKRVEDAKVALGVAVSDNAAGHGTDASADKAVADAKAALDKAQAELAAADQAAKEARSAADKAQADRQAATQAYAKAKADLAAAEAQVKPKAIAVAGANDRLSAAQKLANDLSAGVAGARYDVAKLKAAQAGTVLAEAKKALKQREDARASAEQSAKDAIAAVEKGKADLAAFQKSRQESPAKVQQLTQQLPALRKTLADATSPAESATKDQAEKESLASQAAEVSKKIGELALKATDSKGLADADVAAKKMLEGLSAEVTVAKEKSARWEGARKKAETELTLAEQAIAKEKSDSDNAAAIVAAMNKSITEAQALVPAKQAAAADAGKPIGDAQKQVEQAKSEFERLSAEAQKLAPPPTLTKG